MEVLNAFIRHFSSLSGHSKHFTAQVSVDPFTHTFIHWWQGLPYKVPPAHQEQ